MAPSRKRQPAPEAPIPEVQRPKSKRRLAEPETTPLGPVEHPSHGKVSYSSSVMAAGPGQPNPNR